MKTIKLNCDRPALELTTDGETQRWEYDVVDVKIAFESLERQHQLVQGNSLAAPTAQFLQDAAAMLEGKGLVGCTPAVAYRLHNTVRVQFKRILDELAAQLNE